MSLVQMNFESHFLNSNHEITIILPDRHRDQTPMQFYGSKQKYKVLWLLHGTFGDHSDWLRKTRIELYASERDLVVVMPSGLNSNYANWPDFAMGYAMWDYLTDELMPLIYNWFPVSDRREDNFVAGLSMGGRGALKMAMYHPDKFAAAAVLSFAPADWHGIDFAKADARTRANIRNEGSLEDYLASNENIWDRLSEVETGQPLPSLYIACGTEDFFYQPFLKFKAYAAALQLDATFEEWPGAHEWRFWDTAVEKALDFFGLAHHS